MQAGALCMRRAETWPYSAAMCSAMSQIPTYPVPTKKTNQPTCKPVFLQTQRHARPGSCLAPQDAAVTAAAAAHAARLLYP